ncbi:MAG TPA: transposase, partial [Acidimicrobiales bacterium]|nr:transposase [Acidimicrobiales bacterium]
MARCCSSAPASPLRSLAHASKHDQLTCGGRMRRESHVRSCESRGVRFPPATHRKSHVRFGGRAGETHPSKDGQGAPVRPNTQKVREGGRVVNVSAVIATAVNAEGRREIVGFDVVTTETTEAWTEFLRSLVARGLSGVELIISDAHGGIKNAIATVFDGASWQRCRTHFMANLASRVAKGNWPMIATLVRSIFEQPDRDATWEQLGDVVDKLTSAGFPHVATIILDAADDILAFSAFPPE